MIVGNSLKKIYWKGMLVFGGNGVGDENVEIPPYEIVEPTEPPTTDEPSEEPTETPTDTPTNTPTDEPSEFGVVLNNENWEVKSYSVIKKENFDITDELASSGAYNYKFNIIAKPKSGYGYEEGLFPGTSEKTISKFTNDKILELSDSTLGKLYEIIKPFNLTVVNNTNYDIRTTEFGTVESGRSKEVQLWNDRGILKKTILILYYWVGDNGNTNQRSFYIIPTTNTYTVNIN